MFRAPDDLILKDPTSSQEPYGFDWTLYLAELSSGETIIDSTWVTTGNADPYTLQLTYPSIVTGGRQTQIRLNLGVRGVQYTVTNHIVTSSSVEDERSFRVLIQDR